MMLWLIFLLMYRSNLLLIYWIELLLILICYIQVIIDIRINKLFILIIIFIYLFI